MFKVVNRREAGTLNTEHGTLNMFNWNDLVADVPFFGRVR